jgi:hypothetical protein
VGVRRHYGGKEGVRVHRKINLSRIYSIYSNRHLLDYAGALAAGPDNTDQDSAQTALRYTGNFLHDRLELVALAVIFGDPGQDGSFFRFSAQYELHAALLLTGGVITYQSGDYAMLQDIGDKDRLFVEVKCSF